MRKFTIFLVLALYILQSTVYSPVFAAESTSSAKTATQSASVNLLRQKVDELKKEIASKASDLKKVINTKLQNKAIVGKITRVDEAKITLETKNGSQIVLTNEYTIYQSKKRVSSKKSKPSLKNFGADDMVVAIGDIDDQKNLVAKKLVGIDRKQIENQEGQKSVWGLVENVNSTEVIIKSKDDTKITLLTTAKTTIRHSTSEISYKDIKKGDLIVAVGNLKGYLLETKFIYLASKPLKTEDPKKASPSASLKPTPTPKQTP